MNNVTNPDTEQGGCFQCNGTENTLSNPLLSLVTEDDDECLIHLRCARQNREYGFCWCCRESKVYYADDLNAADECEIHDGESNLAYPEEGAESFFENIQNNV